MNPFYNFINTTGINTTVTMIAIVVGVIGVFTGIGTLTERSKRRFAALEAISKTIESIQSGRQAKMAVLEDFPDHKRLALCLRPYLIRKAKIDQAIKKYQQWYDDVRKMAEKNPTLVLDKDHEFEIETTIAHIQSLQDSI